MRSTFNNTTDASSLIFIFFRSEPEENEQLCVWPLTVIDSFPFYRSTGNQSNTKGTWFPISGINPESFLLPIGETNPKLFDCKKGWLIKPNLAQNIYGCYPEKLVANFSRLLISFNEKEKSKYNSIFSRLGNFEAMIISMLISGGFWEEPIGKDFANFVNENYSNDVETILTCFGNDINLAKNFDDSDTSVPIVESTKENIIKINDWLVFRGSKAINDEYNRPRINFEYTNLSVGLTHVAKISISNFFTNVGNTVFGFFNQREENGFHKNEFVSEEEVVSQSYMKPPG